MAKDQDDNDDVVGGTRPNDPDWLAKPPPQSQPPVPAGGETRPVPGRRSDRLPASRSSGPLERSSTQPDRTPVVYERTNPDPTRKGLPPWLVVVLLIVVVVITVVVLRACSGGGSTAAPVATVTVTVTPSPTETTAELDPSPTASSSFLTPTPTPTSTAGSQTSGTVTDNPAFFWGGHFTLTAGTENASSNYAGVSFDRNPAQLTGLADGDVGIDTNQDGRLVLEPGFNTGRASLWTGTGAPGYDDCNTATSSNASAGIVLQKGQMICVQSSQGRFGYVIVQSLTSTVAVFQATIWEKPS